MTALPDDLREALRRFAARPRVLVALDFDGTLAPIVADPDAARMLPASRRALDRLGDDPGVRLAIVSGRALDSVAAVAGLDDRYYYATSHGVELRPPGGGRDVELTEAERERLAAVDAVLAALVQRHPGSRVERKPAGRALHSRGLDAAASERARAEAEHEVVAALGDAVVVRTGLEVVEFAVREGDKGRALRGIIAREAPEATLFAGDDVTDEDALAVLTGADVGIKVGTAATVAAHRVAGPEEFAEVLTLLAELRAGSAAG